MSSHQQDDASSIFTPDALVLMLEDAAAGMVIRVVGNVTFQTSRALWNAIRSSSFVHRRVIVDLELLKTMDWTGFATLAQQHERLHVQGVALTLRRIPSGLRRTLRSSDLGPLFGPLRRCAEPRRRRYGCRDVAGW